MNFKLKVGDVCKLNEVIPGIHKCNDWKTGLYRVKRIGASMCYGNDREDPRIQSYQFEKIKKDGTVYKSFYNGYRCQAWDKMIDEGKVEVYNDKVCGI
jgi:hypothetical protein